ncbi:MAG: hypothetical protein ACI3VK_05215 [Oscillospiraceae bacterium]
MVERFEKLFELSNNLYSVDSPMIVVAGALLKDTETGKIIVQLKYHSVSTTPIKAIKIGIAAYDVSGKEIEGVNEYQYLDLDIKNGQEFGSNKAIVLPNAVTRAFVIKNLSVVLFDGTTNCLIMPLKPLPQSQLLNVVLKDDELVKQYQIEVNKEAVVTPINHDAVWCCSCGEWNGSNQCTKCGASKIKVLEAFDLDILSKHSNLRLAEEKLQRERQAAAEKAEQERLAELDRQRKLEQERKKAELTVKTKKVAKRVAKVTGIILAAFVVLLVAATILFLNVTNKPIDDDFEQRNEYELYTLTYYVPESWEIDSKQSYDQMKYYVRYDNWGKFMCTMGIKYVGETSETTVDNVVSEYTSTYSNNANTSYESIGGQDFAVVTYTEEIDDNVYYCNVYVTERNSSVFFVCFMSKEENNVIDVFEEIVDAVDFENYVNPREDIYNNAIALMGEGKYTEAIAAFEEIIGYKDTQEKIDECKEARNESKYSEAIALAKNASYKKL